MDDIKIVEMYWQRESCALDETRSKYGKYLYSIAYNILRNNEDSEECENDTYMSAWESMPPNKPFKLSAFLGKITRNLALKKFRNQNTLKRGGGSVTLPIDELYGDLGEAEYFERDIRAEELAEVLNQFLKSLGEGERRIFICRYWYCDSIKEIAKQFGSGQSKIKMTLSRTRKKLFEYLNREGVNI